MQKIMKHLSQLHYHQIPDYELITGEFNVSYNYFNNMNFLISKLINLAGL